MLNHWRIDPTAEPAWRRWDGEIVVHHALSNDTYRLSDLAGDVLLRLLDDAARRWTLDELVEACDIEADDLALLLQQLASLALVEAC
jgi:hypothetical protein